MLALSQKTPRNGVFFAAEASCTPGSVYPEFVRGVYPELVGESDHLSWLCVAAEL